MTHRDHRRTLIDWGNGNWKTCKTVYVHERTELGDHYHKEKDERFMLVKGQGMKTINGKTSLFNLNDVVDVPRLTRHSFILEPDSILIGLASEEFNPKDDYTDSDNSI